MDQRERLNDAGFIPASNGAVQPESQLAELPGSTATVTPLPGEESTPSGPPKGNTKQKSRTPFQESMARFRRDTRAMVSLGIIVFFILLAIFGPPIYQHIGAPYTGTFSQKVIGPEVYHTYDHQEIDRPNEGPSAQYWLGTDAIGRDTLARLMQGVLISIVLAIAVEVVNIVLGIAIGVLAGYYGGWIDQFLARLADLLFAFPGLLFVILIAGILGNWADTHLTVIPIVGPNGNARLLLVSMALAFTAWPLMARYVRGQTLQIKEQQFIEAAKTSGAKNTQIIIRHIVPNLFSIVMVASTLNISNTIVGEAGISYLGLGVQPPGSSLGLMIANAQNVITVYPWELLVPAIVLILIVLAFSFIGDGLRDAFDPHSKD